MRQTTSGNTRQIPVQLRSASDQLRGLDEDGRLSFGAAMRLVPNQLTSVRFITVPVMWIFTFNEQLRYMGIGLLICFVSDLLDGAAARRLNQCSDFGSKFDSLADQLLQISAVFWIVLLMPQIVTENLLLSAVAIGLYGASLLSGLIKFRRLANLHLYSSKAAALFLFFFLIHAFFTGHYSRLLLLLAGALFIISSAETLALQLTSPSVDAGMGSILFRGIPETHPFRRWLSHLP
jgi:cardiolipin synthase